MWNAGSEARAGIVFVPPLSGALHRQIPGSSSAAFFGMGFNQFLGQDYQAEDLGPFGDDVAHDLPPFGAGVGPGEAYGPGYSGEDQEDAEGMCLHLFPDGTEQGMRGLATFGRASFVHEFGGQDGDKQTGPVSDGVAEEGAEVGFGIGEGVENDPS